MHSATTQRTTPTRIYKLQQVTKTRHQRRHESQDARQGAILGRSSACSIMPLTRIIGIIDRSGPLSVRQTIFTLAPPRASRARRESEQDVARRATIESVARVDEDHSAGD